MFKNKKGFTLIELLIVITIIGILAVAFLPTILDAPSKGRDAKRLTNIQSIQTVLAEAMVTDATAYPTTSTCLSLVTGQWAPYATSLGGLMPLDPSSSTHSLVVKASPANLACDKEYAYVANPGTGYSYGLYAKMENTNAGNATCADLVIDASDVTPSGVKDCYALLVE